MRHALALALCCFASTSTADLTINFGDVGSVSCPDTAEPIDIVQQFARAAHLKGFEEVRSVASLQQLITAFCMQRECERPKLAPEITLEIKGLGTIQVLPWIEPATVVEELALLAGRGEATETLTGDNLKQIMKSLCAKVVCSPARLVARLPEIDVTASVSGVGSLTVRAAEEPARMVGEFSKQARAASLPFSDEQARDLLAYICDRRACASADMSAAGILGTKTFDTVSLTVEGYGTAAVAPTQEPADVVEEFARAIIASGRAFSDASMVKMLEYFCARRPCRRVTLNPGGIVETITAQLTNIGTATVAPNEDPADVVENFARQALAAGIEFGAQEMMPLMEFFCSRRPCARLDVTPPADARMRA